jgi:Glycogen debranching enzyme
VAGGFAARPYESLPPLYIQAAGDSGKACARAANAEGAATSEKCGPHAAASFFAEPDWCRNVEYFEERERGFDDSEDLFMPGTLEIALPPLPQGGYVYVAAGTEACGENLRTLWETESRARTDAHLAGGGLAGQLAQAGGQFCITTPSGRATVIAGYPWFDDWGRDTLISLPGLTFYAGREEFGLHVLAEVGRHIRNGLVPNMFSESGEHAYNSVDASLWYAFALQQVLAAVPDGLAWARQHAWDALKAIIKGYRKGPGMGIFVDAEGLLHAGDAHTQLTWMDAQVNGCPVTPRHGCPVEINALWYNTLAFADSLAAAFQEPLLTGERQRAAMRDAFCAASGQRRRAAIWATCGATDSSTEACVPIRYLPCPCRMPCLRTIFSRRLWNACATGCSRLLACAPLPLMPPHTKADTKATARAAMPPTIRALSGPGCWAIMLMHCCTRPGI